MARPKTYDFHTEWEEDYFFVHSNSKTICLICKASMAIPKKEDLERHFKTLHKKYETDFPAKTELRSQKVRELKTQLAAQQSVSTRPNTKGKAATIASYRVSRVLAEHKKSFKAFIEAADVLFGDLKNKTEPTEKTIPCSSGGDRCRTHRPAAPHRCEVAKQR